MVGKTVFAQIDNYMGKVKEFAQENGYPIRQSGGCSGGGTLGWLS